MISYLSEAGILLSSSSRRILSSASGERERNHLVDVDVEGEDEKLCLIEVGVNLADFPAVFFHIRMST